jgi:DNA polymerase (family X)
MSNRNQEIIDQLRELVELTIIDEGGAQSFRARAYENAIIELESVRSDIASMTQKELVALDGVGKSIAQKIREYLDTGTIAKRDALRAKYPREFLELTRVPGLGPKTMKLLRDQLGVENVADLRADLAAHRVRELPRMGEKSEQKLMRALERLGLHGKADRKPIASVLGLADEVVADLRAVPGVVDAMCCGSLRRFSETIGDIDIVVAAAEAEPVMEAFAAMPRVRDVVARGDTKASVVTHNEVQIDVRVVRPDNWGAAILYFTGSKTHNIKLRQRAIDRGWRLNEYALAEESTGQIVAAATEEEIYRALDLPWLPPPQREDFGEIEAAERGELPELVGLQEVRGDLHVHTSRSGDAHDHLAAIVAAAAERGYAYLAITDHGEDLPGGAGVSRDQMLAQADEIAALRAEYPELTILHGVELNIGPDGQLDYDAELRGRLDWCIAGIHSHFDLDAERQTRRLITALQDPVVRGLAHLSSRLIGERPAIECDLDAVLEAAARTGTAIEINLQLARLDPAADVLRRARALDVMFYLASDAHAATELAAMRHAVHHTARGWVERERILNTRSLAGLQRWLTEGR